MTKSDSVSSMNGKHSDSDAESFNNSLDSHDSNEDDKKSISSSSSLEEQVVIEAAKSSEVKPLETKEEKKELIVDKVKDAKKPRSKSRSHSKGRHKNRHKEKGDRHRRHRHRRRRSRSKSSHRHSRSHRHRSSDRHKHRRRHSSHEEKERSKRREERHTKKRSHSRSNDRRRDRDRRLYRTRSRSHSPSSKITHGGKRTFKDEMREKFLASEAAATVIANNPKSEAAQNAIAAAQAAAKAASTGTNLMDAIEKARVAHELQAKAMQEKAEALTGVSIPKFYNPTALNPMKFAEQQTKRKLLWSKKEDVPDVQKNVNLWTGSSVNAAGGNTQAAAKFRKLMGIHNDVNPDAVDSNTSMVDQKELFTKLDQQYEAARSHTHTQRGVGLGYSQSAYIDPNAYIAHETAHPVTSNDKNM